MVASRVSGKRPHAAKSPVATIASWDLESDPKFKDLKVFDVDFDSQKDVVRNFKATMQSTLITFKGDHETARSVGDTNPDSIGALLEKAI